MSDEEEFDDEYAAELKRRIAEIDDGTAELVSCEEAIESAQKGLEDVRRNRRK